VTDPSASNILELVRQHAEERHQPAAFDPENPCVPASGRVFGAEEVVELGRTSLDFWPTAGPEATAFERGLAKVTGHRHALLVNSGSSANLLAMSALTSPTLGERQLRPGDEVVTVAAGFPTTVNPIIQSGLVPVFVDVTLPTYNIDVDALRAAIGPRTRAVMVAHTLGNPFDLDGVTEVCREHGLHLIEDCCDALGSQWNGAHVGTFGDLATLSFYSGHQITLGEGGAVLTNRPRLKQLVESFRDCGRDCWCEPGCSHVGYNLKAADMQAAIGQAQLARLDDLVARRRANHAFLRRALEPWAEHLILPGETPGGTASWFGFAITVRPSASYTKHDLVTFLHGKGIDSQQLMGGNLLRQPAHQNIEHRVSGSLEVTDLVADSSFWIGCHPGIGQAHLEYVADTFAEFHSTSAVRLAA
jgi:CDP-6-deoxy-D-xylo-4-hexulose-3-dehydrase